MATGQSIAKGVYGFMQGVDDLFKAGTNQLAENQLRSNKAINKISKVAKGIVGNSTTGIAGTLNSVSKGQGWGEALKGAHTLADGAINWKAVGGTYMGAAVALRAAGGGGMYRDRTGRVNVPGVPFV